MMYNLEYIESFGQSLESGESGRMTDNQIDYLSELNITPQEWEIMDSTERGTLVDILQERVNELPPVIVNDANLWIKENFEPKLASQYLEKLELNKQIEASLGRIGKEIWNSLHLENSASRTLVSDITENPQLCERLRENPSLLKIYANNIESHYRTDITMLRYGHYEADHYRSMYYRQPENHDWIKGEDIKLVDVGSKTEIRYAGTDSVLGYLSGDRKSGYLIEVTNNDALLNLYPLRNAEYRFGNCIFRTDDFGRPIQVKTIITDNVESAGRDTDFIKRIRDFKNGFDLETQSLRPTSRLQDDGSHLIADSWGGKSFAMNIVPQNSAINQGGIWRISEDAGLKAARNGSRVERVIDINYSDNRSLRPSSFILNQTVDGVTTVNNVVLENIKIEKR